MIAALKSVRMAMQERRLTAHIIEVHGCAVWGARGATMTF